MKSDSLESKCISNFEILESELGKLPRSLSTQYYQPKQLTPHTINDQLCDIYYQNDQDGRLTNSYWGAIATSSENIKTLEYINVLKSNFQKSVIQLRQSNQNTWLNTYNKINSREDIISAPLTNSGLSRLHLKQTYRQIPILKSQPIKIAFSWYTSGRSITKMSKQQVLDKLIHLGEDKTHIQMQINLLSQVNDTHFAQIQNQAPTIRANILFNNGQTQSLNTSLPIFFETDNNSSFPLITELPENTHTQRQRKVRSDIKIDNECFIKSLRIHRYL